VVTLTEQTGQQSTTVVTATAVAARINGLASANRLSGASARHGGLAAASGLDFTAAVAAVVVLAEQAGEQPTAAVMTATAVTARVYDFATAGRLDRTAINRGFATTRRLDVATAVAAIAAQFVKQASIGVGRARSDQSDRQQSRNDYTTHRDISMDLGFNGKVLPQSEPQHVRAAQIWPAQQQCTGGFPATHLEGQTVDDSGGGIEVDRRVAARVAHLEFRWSQTAIDNSGL